MINRLARGLATAPILTAVLASTPAQAKNDNFKLVSTIAFSNTFGATVEELFNNGEIYLIDPDGANPRRLTHNDAADGFATLSPDGKKIVFDSNRLRDVTTEPPEPLNVSDLFVMNTDGTEQTHLTRGASPTWSPDSKHIAFHASASGTGQPILSTPGAATTDSDLFIANVDDLLAAVETPQNITNNPTKIDDDPDWSPDGTKLVFTSHDVNAPNHNNAVSAEVYVINADGSGAPKQLTFNLEEERAPAWSPDGTRIVFSCRRGGMDFEICVMNADGTGQVQLTDNTMPDLTASWSPDGQQIVFHRPPVAGQNQLFVMNTDGTGVSQITNLPGQNLPGQSLFANWGELRIHVKP